MNVKHAGDVLLYERKHIKNGLYYHRILVPEHISIGDTFEDFRTIMTVTKIISQKDSNIEKYKGQDSLFECEMQDNAYGTGLNYSPVSNI